jgi:LysR family transcriptional regulator for bpeEF and oprC
VDAAIKGFGLIHLPDAFVKTHLLSGELITVYPQWEYDTRTFYAVTPKARYISPKVHAFIEFLTAALRVAGDPGPHGLIPVRTGRKRSK